MSNNRLIPVILESPYSYKNVTINVLYARAAMKHSLMKGEAPFASHLLYTQRGILDDDIPYERSLGINAGFVWREFVHMTVVYGDYGITKGMEEGILHARKLGQKIEFRSIKTIFPHLVTLFDWGMGED